jgi:hypothetical protein
METTYDVRVYKTETYRGTHVSSYRMRWKTAGKDWCRTFRNKAQADVFRGELLAAARKGEVALARWIDSHPPKGGKPLWLRIRKVGSGISYVGTRNTRSPSRPPWLR